MDDVLVRIENAGVRYKNFSMKSVNLELPRGYIIGVQGPNGAGKSTLLKMILGNIRNMQGTIEVDGIDVRDKKRQFLDRIGVVSEEKMFFEAEDAIKNEAYFSVFYPNWDGNEYRKMLRKLNVFSGKSIRTMAKGERLKYQLAFSAAYRPRLLILDEPTAGLDPVFRDDFLKILTDFVADYETTVLLATHLDEDLNKVADFIIDVVDGVCTMREVGA